MALVQSDQSELVVIGGGVVGVTIALALQSNGHNVRILDRKGISVEASRGNAGAFAFSDIEPLAAPGSMRKAPKWLLDPLGPLSIRPTYVLKLAPWLYRFWRASKPDRYREAVQVQSELMQLSSSALERLIQSVAGESFFRREGQLQLYEGQRSFFSSLPAWELRKKHGIPFTLIESCKAIAEIQPGIDPRFTHAVFTPTWLNVSDPSEWTNYLAKKFIGRGGQIELKEVVSLAPKDVEGVRLMTSSGEEEATQVVVAAGAWSHILARTLGDNIPLETERGYNTTFPTSSYELNTHLTFHEHGFVVSKIGEGLRVGGAVELGGLSLPPNFKRADVMLRKAKQFLPQLSAEGGTQWMGFRPSTSDSLPVIGRSPIANKVIYAFGHGHLGLTQSAGTAELVAEIAANSKTPFNLNALRPDRF